MINRNNYEEFFLLYIDNELSPEERRMVEVFVRDNSDLGHELTMMQQLKLHPEKIVFEGRESLLKPVISEGASINHTNYEEYFILYTDNELNAAQRLEVEAFLVEHPTLQEAFNLFAMTRIEPDHELVFEDKASLYRQEEPARIVVMPWMRVAVAVMVFLGTGFLVFTKLNTVKQDPIAGITTTNPVVKPNSGSAQPPIAKNTEQAVTNPSGNSLQQTDKREARKHPVTVKTSSQFLVAEIRVKRKDITEKRMGSNNIVTVESVQTEHHVVASIDYQHAEATHGSELLSTSGNINNLTAKNEPTTSDVAQQVYSEPAVNRSEDGIYSSDNTSKNPKMRGFFRKVTRVFEKTANAGQEDGKGGILIGGLQIATR